VAYALRLWGALWVRLATIRDGNHSGTSFGLEMVKPGVWRKKPINLVVLLPRIRYNDGK
jgi:hypothetical protein